MERYFEEGEIRMKAEQFTGDFLERVVRGLAVENKRVLIGGDTRESTKHILEKIELSLANSNAREVGNVGIFPTPAINYIMYALVYDYAIDVTASHRPYVENGIKIFEYTDTGGVEIDNQRQADIEQILGDDSPLDFLEPRGETAVYDERNRGLRYYLNHLIDYLGENTNFADLSVVIDCANGATGTVGGRAFELLGASALVINNELLFGKKINDDVGSTHIESLQTIIKDRARDDFGVAFDGDGGKCIFVDEAGNVVSSDKIMAILAKSFNLDRFVFRPTAELHGDTNGPNITTEDSQSLQSEMLAQGVELGGKQDGYIILPGETMSDGMLTALVVAKIIKASGKKLSELAGGDNGMSYGS